MIESSLKEDLHYGVDLENRVLESLNCSSTALDGYVELRAAIRSAASKIHIDSSNFGCQDLKFTPETESGNCEYKLILTRIDDDRITNMASQMKWRLGEGAGEAIYYIGVTDDGSPVGILENDFLLSVINLHRIANRVKCLIRSVRILKGLRPGCFVCRAVVNTRVPKQCPKEARIVFLGDEGCGKSTLIGVLERNNADDGNGSARLRVLQHQHELETGCTSSVSLTVLVFTSKSLVDLDDNFRYSSNFSNVLSGQKLQNLADEEDHYEGSMWTVQNNAADSPRLATLIDVGGNPRFIKSACSALMLFKPDFAMVVVNSLILRKAYEGQKLGNKDIYKALLPVTLTEIELLKHLGIGFAFVVTHMDKTEIITGPDNYRTRDGVASLLAYTGVTEVSPTPVFFCSNVSLEGISPLRNFIGTLKVSAPSIKNENFCMFISGWYFLDDVNKVVVYGIPLSGSAVVNDKLKLGPDLHGKFCTVVVESIRTSQRTSIHQLVAGHFATLGVRRWSERSKRNAQTGASILAWHTADDCQKPDLEKFISERSFFKSLLCSSSFLSSGNCFDTKITNKFLVKVSKWFCSTKGESFASFPKLLRGEAKCLSVQCATFKGKAKVIDEITADCLLLQLCREPALILTGSNALLNCGRVTGIATIDETYPTLA